MRERECGEHDDSAHHAAAAFEQLVHHREREEREVRGPELRVHAPAPPDEALVLEPEAPVARQQPRGGARQHCRGRGRAHPPQRPPHGERQRHEQQPAHDVEQCEEVDQAEQRAMQRDDREVREVLVIHERRESELHLRHPEVERVLAAREGLVRALDVGEMVRVVVVARQGDGDLR